MHFPKVPSVWTTLRSESRLLRAGPQRGPQRPFPRLLDRDQLADRRVGWPRLEAHDDPHAGRLGQPLERGDARAMLAGLDARDRRVAGAHTLGELFLREPKLGPTHDHEAS